MLLNALIALVLTAPGATHVCRPTDPVYDYIQLRGANQSVALCKTHNSGPGVAQVAVFFPGAYLYGLTVTGAGATGVKYFAGSSGTIEYSHVCHPVYRPNQDAWAVHSGTTGQVIVKHNTLCDSGVGSDPGSGPMVVEDNDITATTRTDCKGRQMIDGPCNCGEFGLAPKSGNWTIRGNRISGYIKGDPNCGGSGAPGGAGITTAACGHAIGETCPSPNIVIEGNTITNSFTAIYVSPTSTNLIIRGNTLCGAPTALQDGFGFDATIVDNDYSGLWSVYGPHTGRVEGNRLSDIGCRQ